MNEINTSLDNMEFPVGTEITVDRYNPVGEEVKTKIIEHKVLFAGTDPWYVVLINGTEISVRGGSIMESVQYDPVPADQRHKKERF